MCEEDVLGAYKSSRWGERHEIRSYADIFAEVSAKAKHDIHCANCLITITSCNLLAGLRFISCYKFRALLSMHPRSCCQIQILMIKSVHQAGLYVRAEANGRFKQKIGSM